MNGIPWNNESSFGLHAVILLYQIRSRNYSVFYIGIINVFLELLKFVFMLYKISGFQRLTPMGCCSCFGFTNNTRKLKPSSAAASLCSQEFLLNGNLEDSDTDLYNGIHGSYGVLSSTASENILSRRAQNGMICRGVPVKETRKLIRSEDENGDKMVNEYVRVCKIGSGSYGKVVLYRSIRDGKQYAIKAFHKSHLLKLRVAPSETAMTDVLREVSIMKMLEHPNIVNLVEVIDDPNMDNFYMVLEYVESKWVCQDSDPPKGLDEITARRYLRGIVAGVMYLHSHNVIHGDIKPDNLLITSSGTVKIGDFSVSQVFEDGKDELRRSPGTPVFTAPECCSGVSYHGKASDTWAVGVTLYCMILGRYPFLGDTLQETYDKIVNNPINIPESIDLQLKNLLERLLCKDPNERITLEAVALHPWAVQEEGSIPEYVCLCKRRKFSKGSNGF